MSLNKKINKSKRNILRKTCFGLMTAVIIFCGCKKDEVKVSNSGSDGITKLEITVEDGKEYSGKIDKVKLTFHGNEALATADYNDGKFTLNLPETVAGMYLFGVGGYSSTVTVSNPNAQGAGATIPNTKR
jgi:hypothetical protein